jgi:hypothetical protein
MVITCFLIAMIGLDERSKQIERLIENKVELHTEYEKKVLQSETEQTWVPLEDPCPFEEKGHSLEGSISKLQTILTMKENIQIVDFAMTDQTYHDAKDWVYGKGTEKVRSMMIGDKEEYENLARLMIAFDIIDDDPLASEMDKLKDMYTLFLTILPKNRLTANAPQIQMLLANGGDCNDITAALWAILNYFHIETYVEWGKICYNIPQDDGTQKGLHAWLKVKLKDGTRITLDPTWYQKEFVILPDRGNLSGNSLKADRMRYK